MIIYNFKACLSYFTDLHNILLKNIRASQTEFSLARLASGKKIKRNPCYSVWFLTLQLCGRCMLYNHFDAVVDHSLPDYVIKVVGDNY